MLLPVRCGGTGGTAGAEAGTKQAPQHHRQRPHERPSAEVIPQGEDTQATAARAAATYTATGSIPIIEKRTYQQ